MDNATLHNICMYLRNEGYLKWAQAIEDSERELEKARALLGAFAECDSPLNRCQSCRDMAAKARAFLATGAPGAAPPCIHGSMDPDGCPTCTREATRPVPRAPELERLRANAEEAHQYMENQHKALVLLRERAEAMEALVRLMAEALERHAPTYGVGHGPCSAYTSEDRAALARARELLK